MKTALFIFLLSAGVALADVNLSIAKDQAKRAAGQNSAQQGSQPPSAPQPPPTDPALVATLQNIARLRADFASISAADATTAADQRISLLNNLSAAAQGTKAPVAGIRKLAGHLISALAGHKDLSAQDQTLARDVHALFNGAHLSATQQETLLDGVKKTLTDAGVSADDTALVIDDLKTVAAETK